MPVKQINGRTRSATAPQLTDRLVDEWRNPQPNASQPIILEERDAAKKLRHIYVVWDDWADLQADERSEIVLSAMEIVKGTPAVLDVTVAMGLTRAEADRMRIPYS